LSIFSRKIRNRFFSEEEKASIVDAIKHAERRTSGEVRVFVESRCRYMDAIDRAADIFINLKMDKTDDRNAVLLYVAMKDRQLAVFGDEGIHQKLGDEYWNEVIGNLIRNFNKSDYAKGIAQSVSAIGEALHYHFPFDKDTDKNELPDDIVFGK
jgi:uncharacterized membrane protein